MGPGKSRLVGPSWATLWGFLIGLSLAYGFAISAMYLLGSYPRHRVETGWLIFGGLASVTALTRVSTDTLTATGPTLSRSSAWAVAVAVGAALILYLPSLQVGFLSDDFGLFLSSQRWEVAPPQWEHLRPLPLAVWAIFGALGLADPAVLHLVSIIVHGLNAYLVYCLGLELRLTSFASVSAALLFLTFAGAVEAVTWLAGFQDVLATSLVLGFLLAAIRNSFVSALTLVVLATLSKETAVAAPVLLLLLRPLRRVNVVLLSVAFGWVLLFAAGRLYLRPAEDMLVQPSRYFVKEILVRLYGGLSLPWTRDQLAGFPILALASIIAITLALAVLVRQFSDGALWKRAFIFALCALAAVLPVYRYFHIAPDLGGARYLYFPAVGWSLFLAVLATRYRPRIARALVLVITVAGVGGVITQQGRWKAAAQYRDQIVETAIQTSKQMGCQSPVFVSGPDNIQGVYVFRNGLSEAVSMTLGNAAKPVDCVLEWVGGRFVRVK